MHRLGNFENHFYGVGGGTNISRVGWIWNETTWSKQNSQSVVKNGMSNNNIPWFELNFSSIIRITFSCLMLLECLCEWGEGIASQSFDSWWIWNEITWSKQHSQSVVKNGITNYNIPGFELNFSSIIRVKFSFSMLLECLCVCGGGQLFIIILC